MEPLALLCNLYGEGPATLRRLHRAGCDSLVVLAALEASGLAERTGWERPAAERFLREARLLLQRVDGPAARPRRPAGEPLLDGGETEDPRDTGTVAAIDPDPDQSEGGGAPGGAPGGRPAGSAAARPRWGEGGEGREGREGPPDSLGSGRERMLEAWRELDREDPPRALDELRPAPPPERPAARPLAPGLVEGLGPALVEGLRAAGVGSLEELARGPALALARRLGVGYTRLARLQFLAQRALAGPSRAHPAPLAATSAPAPPAKSAGAAAGGPDDEPSDAAGPFA